MKNQLFKYFFSLVSLLFLINLAACASMDKSECTAANWEIIGLEDGSKGRKSNYIGHHRKACVKHHIAPNLTQYLKGHKVGVQQFCTAENGYQQGKQGSKNNGVCPPNIFKEFNRGFNQGSHIYAIQTNINQVENNLNQLNQQLQQIENDIHLKEEEIINTNGQYQRREILAQIKDLQRNSKSIQFKINNLEIELYRQEETYQGLINTPYQKY